MHGVQRFPLTETQGLLHTGTAFIAVLPQHRHTAAAARFEDGDVKIDVYRASGAGSQHVNKNESSARHCTRAAAAGGLERPCARYCRGRLADACAVRFVTQKLMLVRTRGTTRGRSVQTCSWTRSVGRSGTTWTSPRRSM